MNMTWTQYNKSVVEQERTALNRWWTDLGATPADIRAGRYSLALVTADGNRVYELWDGGYERGVRLGRLVVSYTPEAVTVTPAVSGTAD